MPYKAIRAFKVFEALEGLVIPSKVFKRLLRGLQRTF
jgi:hypothetical protein